MSRRETRLSLDRRTLLGGALLGGVGAALGATPAQAATPRTGRALPRPEIVPVDLAEPAVLLRMLTTPVRVYDSRADQAPNGTDPITGATDTRLVANAGARRIDVSYVLGEETAPTGVLTTSSAVLLNITLVGALGPSGYVKVWADGATEPIISTMNWDHANAVIANGLTTRHGNGYIKIACGGPVGASTNVVIDAIGMYIDLVV